MAWLTGWNRRKLITVTGSSDGAQSNYQMKLTINQTSGADSPGTVYLGGNVISSPAFADVRFTKSDGSTSLNYWIESTTGTSPNQIAKVWIKLAPSPDTIPISPGTYGFYIYYNNPSATTTSDGTNTFIFFDDFNNNTMVNWTYIGSSPAYSCYVVQNYRMEHTSCRDNNNNNWGAIIKGSACINSKICNGIYCQYFIHRSHRMSKILRLDDL